MFDYNKKLKLENLKEYETSTILSSVNFTLVNKMFELAKVRCKTVVNSLNKRKRKYSTNLTETLIDETYEKKKNLY